MKGKLKEAVGQATNNPDREAGSKAENLGGKVQKKVGQVEKIFESEIVEENSRVVAEPRSSHKCVVERFVGGKRTAVSFGIYIVGFLILIGGLIYGAVILHVAAHWIAVGAIVLLGLAILKGVQATRGKDPS